MFLSSWQTADDLSSPWYLATMSGYTPLAYPRSSTLARGRYILDFEIFESFPFTIQVGSRPEVSSHHNLMLVSFSPSMLPLAPDVDSLNVAAVVLIRGQTLAIRATNG